MARRRRQRGKTNNRHPARDHLKRNVKKTLGIKKPKLGDQGQRYEVWADYGGEAMRIGWASGLEGLVNPLRSNHGVGRIVAVDRERDQLLCCECLHRSSNPDDIDKKYCPNCAAFLTDPKPVRKSSETGRSTEEPA